MDNEQKASFPLPDLDENFHIYSIEWEEEQIDFYVDGQKYFTAYPQGGGINDQKAWPFAKEFYLILNVAFGGTWGGKEGIDLNVLPTTMFVDYVRYYKKT